MSQKLRILVIDDHQDSLDSVSEALALNGYQTSKYLDPRQAVEAFHQGDFEVIITDMKMPGMNGLEVLQAMKSRKPEVYVIIMTGYADLDNAIEALNHKAYAFFRKPVDLESLIHRLAKIEAELRAARINIHAEDNLFQLYMEYKQLELSLNPGAEREDRGKTPE